MTAGSDRERAVVATRARAATGAALTAATAAALWLAGCATVPDSDPVVVRCAAPGFGAPHHDVDPCDPLAVISAAARTVFTYRPDHEPGPGTSFGNAAALLDPAYRQHTVPGLLDPAAAADWDRWRAAGVTVTASAHIAADDHPPDLPRTLARVVAVVQQASDQPTPRRFAVYVTASRDTTTTPWRVTGMATR